MQTKDQINRYLDAKEAAADSLAIMRQLKKMQNRLEVALPYLPAHLLFQWAQEDFVKKESDS